jgi:hypothetical protein
MANFDMHELPVDYVALFGYLSLFIFFGYKLSDTFKRPVDLIANLSLLAGLAALIVYHYRKIMEKIDEKNNDSQKQARLVAHSTIVVFFLLTLTTYSTAVYRFYDNFGLLGHTFLLWTVATNNNQIIGLILLALYFFFATYRKIKVTGNMEVLNLIGRTLLTIFFITVSIIGIIDLSKK